MSFSHLPALNAALNTLSACLLIFAFILIKRGRVGAHRVCMLAALGSSSLFLVSYLVYHFQVGHVPYGGEGVLRVLYLFVLATHVVLAAVILPMIGTTLWMALRGDGRHRRMGRWTFATWLYVSVTGVAIFWMLRPYQPSFLEGAARAFEVRHGPANELVVGGRS